MATSASSCVNHPREQTRVSCSSCGAPICTRCMRDSAVGQKCPACARVPRRARALGKPIHYVRAIAAGAGLAIAGGFGLGQLLFVVGFGMLIGSAVIGYLVGRVVRWGAAGQTQQPFGAVAAGCAVAGLALGVTLAWGTPLPGSPLLLLGYALGGFLATRGLRS